MTDTILKTWPVSPTTEVRLIECGAWNLCTADSEYRYRVVTVRNGAEVDEDVFDEMDDAACEGRNRARVLAEDIEEDAPEFSGKGA